MSLLSSSIGRVRCLADEEADHNMLQDLQLAAELGKTLLERNKELENCIKLHQCTIDDQAQEIEYMKKQTAALREVNDSRLKIYEQLEVSIQDLERANHRLALENASDKKQIKSQCLTIDTLEARIDELQKKYDDLHNQYEALQRDQQSKPQPQDVPPTPTIVLRDGSTHNNAASPKRTSPDEEAKIQQLATVMANDEDVTKLLQQLQEVRYQKSREQKRGNELKEQLDALLIEHVQMEEQLNMWKAKAQDMKNLQDEINRLEEVRQGQLCGRCLRGVDSRTQDELSVMLDQEEDDDISLVESLAESIRDADATLQEFSKTELSEEDNCNSYRELVEKYEALLKVQQNPAFRRKSGGACTSLQEELQMSGEFSSFNGGQSEPDSVQENGRASSTNLRREGSVRGAKKPFVSTPTDFSEAETSSSGFSDETSNKATQTEGRPGSFLCSIADGEDCKFSIYDDSSSFESRFHRTPEYRRIFSDMFKVLKRAADAKDKGTELPLLEEASTITAGTSSPKPEQLSLFSEDAASELTDDARSIVSLAVSSVVSEPVFRVHTPPERPQAPETPSAKSRAGHAPATRRQPLEYLSVQVRKKGSAKKPSRRQANQSLASSGTTSSEAPGTPDVLPAVNPRMFQSKNQGRRKFRPLTTTDFSDGFVWNGNTTHFYPSKSPKARHSGPREPTKPSFEYKPSTASEEVAKLRRLEMSYAEALRLPNKAKSSGARQRRHY